jgi:HK97 family phage prohead protease
MKRDTRCLLTTANVRVETRAAADGSEAKYFTGWALRYEEWSDLIGNYFRERFMKGAFRDSLGDSRDVIATVDHKTNLLLGRMSAGTLAIKEDDEGIYAEALMPETSYARDLAVSVQRGDVKGMSFTFDIPGSGDERWYHDADGVRKRDIQRANLYEVAWVTNPAYPQTEASMRALEMVLETERGLLDVRKKRLALAEKCG